MTLLSAHRRGPAAIVPRAARPLLPAPVPPGAVSPSPASSGAIPARAFLRRHALWPLVTLAVLSGWSLGLGGDAWWADRLYAWQGGRWALQRAFLTESVIHRFGRDASTAAWLAVLALWATAMLRPAWAGWRRPLAYLLLATATTVTVVAALKAVTDMDCPWDLARYGGQRPFIGLLQVRPAGLGRGQCFPAGHASAGYAWVALYFFFLAVGARWRWLGLAAGLGLGLVFGFSQQARGAHFFSHDLWTLAIAWFAALGWYAVVHGPSAIAARASAQAAAPMRARCVRPVRQGGLPRGAQR